MIHKTAHGFPELMTDAATAAQRLLGAELIRTFPDGSAATVKIVETEAYDQTDAASHSYKHQTPRTAMMFGPAGFLYVYFTYGMHYCMNVVCGQDGEGAAVLIRAVEPLSDVDLMAEKRRGKTGFEMTNGPAKTCQALLIDKTMNGHDLSQAPFQLRLQPPILQTDIQQTIRIGISQAQDVPWRFYLKGNPFVSKL